MIRIPSIVALLLAAAFTATAPPSLAASAADAPVVDQFSPSVNRFHASAEAKRAAHPSYALLAEPDARESASTTTLIPTFSIIDGKQSVSITIKPGTSLYGTGEVAGPLLRNGKRITCWNTDAYGYGPEAVSLYQSHPWVLGLNADGSAFGLLADTTYKCAVDTGYTSPDQIIFTADGPTFPLIIIEKATPQEVLTELAHLTGTMPLPPKWALGYHQCRYSYYPESRVREIADGFRSRDIPCDVIWFDIDYMEAFRIFTFDRGYFPDPKQLNADLLAQGFHNVWMIDPGMKSRTQPGSSDRKPAELEAEGPTANAARAKELAAFQAMMDSGTKNDVWVKRADGSSYEGEVWPGWCHFPDYTNPTVRLWWSGLYDGFMANGVSGVWNDMNEPAVFNVASKTMPLDNRHAGDTSLLTPAGTPQGDAAAGDHARYHNVYGMQMIRGTREAIARINPDKRPFVLSRANYIGGQRYGATWTGDNSATWAHMEESIPMSLNVGLSGQPFIGPDIGGFAGNGDGKLFARWMGFGALLPFSRGHTGKGNIDKEPWAFGPGVEATCKAALELRYRLMPHFYTVFHEATTTGLPVARPLFFADPTDLALRSEDDSFLIGDGLLVQAQMLPDGTRVPVMPRGNWRLLEPVADPDMPRLFVKPGAIIPMGPVMEFVDEKPLDELTLIVNLDENGKATGTLYEDAGDGYGYQSGEFRLSTIAASLTGSDVKVDIVQTDGSMPPAKRTLKVIVLNERR